MIRKITENRALLLRFNRKQDHCDSDTMTVAAQPGQIIYLNTRVYVYMRIRLRWEIAVARYA